MEKEILNLLCCPNCKGDLVVIENNNTKNDKDSKDNNQNNNNKIKKVLRCEVCNKDFYEKDNILIMFPFNKE